jgi:hypothetical protein
VNEATFYRWKKHAGLDVGELQEFRALRDEHATLPPAEYRRAGVVLTGASRVRKTALNRHSHNGYAEGHQAELMIGHRRSGIIVLGMHRSGTSALTGALALLGGVLPRTLMEPSDDNPRGYGESKRIAHLNDRLLRSAGIGWRDPVAIPDQWFSPWRRVIHIAQIRRLLASEYVERGTILVKDPRICRLLPLWRWGLRSAGVTPKVLLVIRDPYEVAASLASRAHNPVVRQAAVRSSALSLVLWLRYVLEAERSSRGLPRKLIEFSDMLTDWQIALEPTFAARFIPRPDSQRVARIDDFINANLRRHRTEELQSMAASRPTAEFLRAVYRTIGDATAGSPTAVALCDQIRLALDRHLAAQPLPPEPSKHHESADAIWESVLANVGKETYARATR